MAHQFGGPEQQTGMEMRIDLLVWRGHMRFLFPSTDTRPTSWRGRAQQVGEITIHEWPPWADTRSNDNEKPTGVDIYPCETCFKLRRFAPPGLQSQEADSAGGIQSIQRDDSHYGSMRQLRRLRGVRALPLLDHPPDRMDMMAGTYIGPPIEIRPIRATRRFRNDFL